MKRFDLINNIRYKLRQGQTSIGSWIQIPNSSTAEIMGQSGYDWVAVDLEHGSISVEQLPDLFRSLELGGTLPLVRLAQGHPKDCKQALDAGAGGVIVPMVHTSEQIEAVQKACCWPPSGIRGVGYSRANLFGKHFISYQDEEAQSPLFIAQVEHIDAVNNIEDILSVSGLDAVFIGPYDLSASMGITGQFKHKDFLEIMSSLLKVCIQKNMPIGLHVVQPDAKELNKKISEGYKFIAFSIDSVFLHTSSQIPE